MRIRTVLLALVLLGAGLTGCSSTDASGERASGPDAAAPPTTTLPSVTPSSPTDDGGTGGGTGGGGTGGGGGGGTGGGGTPNPGDPPKTPSDTFPTSFITGTVVVGGSGPCYGLESDEGTRYALYGNAGRPLTFGDRIRVKVAAQTQAVNCGPGKLMRIVSVVEPGQ